MDPGHTLRQVPFGALLMIPKGQKFDLRSWQPCLLFLLLFAAGCAKQTAGRINNPPRETPDRLPGPAPRCRGSVDGDRGRRPQHTAHRGARKRRRRSQAPTPRGPRLSTGQHGLMRNRSAQSGATRASDRPRRLRPQVRARSGRNRRRPARRCQLGDRSFPRVRPHRASRHRRNSAETAGRPTSVLHDFWSKPVFHQWPSNRCERSSSNPQGRRPHETLKRFSIRSRRPNSVPAGFVMG